MYIQVEQFIYFLTLFYMKRLAFTFVTGLAVMALSAVPVFADAHIPPSDPTSTSAPGEAAISTPVDLSTWFSAEQLTLLSVDEQKTLVDKLNALAGDPVVFKKKVNHLRDWLTARLKEQKEKMENQAQWEAKQKAKFEAKVDAEFARLMREKKDSILMREKKDSMESERRMQEKDERIKRMEAKRALMKAARARRAAKPKVLQAWVASVDAVNGVIVLKREGAQAKVLVNAKTVLVVIEDDGARTGTLADFQAGDRIFGLVRRNLNDHSLVGVVLVKMQAHDVDDDDDVPTPVAPPADSETTPPPADSGTTPPATN